MTLPVFPLQIALTFSIVFAVIVYRITTAAALSLNKDTRSNVRVTVTATAVIINLVVILILDEIYGAVAKWLTQIGTVPPHCVFAPGPLERGHSVCAMLLVVIPQHEKRNKNKMLCIKHFNWGNEEMPWSCPDRTYQGHPSEALPAAI